MTKDSLLLRLGALLLPAGLLLPSCAGEQPADDDSVTPPDDDDDSTPEDDSPRMSFEPHVVQAGELAVVFTTLDNFVLGDQAMACCASDDVRYYRVEEQINERMYDILFYFGLRGDGAAQWGIEDDGVQVIGDFEIEPLGDVPELAIGMGAGTASLDESGAFDVFTFEVLEPNSLVSIRASNMSEDQHPWLWVLEDDGITGVVNAGFAMGDGFEAPALGFYAEEPGSYFLRLDENDDEAGGDGWTCDIDLLIEPAGELEPHDEVEPNDEAAAWQDLGVFAPGVHRVSGVAAAAGHDADNDLSGDLDVFWFQLDQAAYVEFELNWQSDDDLDVMLYQGTPDQVSLGFGSDQAISYRMASAAQPESMALSLPPGSYVVEIGNWEGAPDASWEIDLRVIPMNFGGE